MMIRLSSTPLSNRVIEIGFAAFGFFALAATPAFAAPQQISSTTAASTNAVVAASSDTPQTSVPRLVQFNGTLKDSAARPIAGVASVTFAIYAEQDGGSALWSETQNVIADANGHFATLLGGATPNGMPAELFGTGESRWLGITVGHQQEMPRVLLASVPYALKAADADTLGGLPASAYVTTQSLAAINAKSASATFTGGNTTIVATPQAASTLLTPSGVPQVTPTGSGSTDFIPIWTSGSALGNSTIFESAGLVGIGTTTPAETLDVNGNSIFRGSFQLPPGHPATASSGYESHSFQFQASSFNSSTQLSDTEAFGFRAEPLNNNSTTPAAKLDLFYGPGGGTLTDTGLSFAANGIVTFAANQTFPGIANLAGNNVFTGSESVNTANTTGITATTSAPGGTGIIGTDSATTGSGAGVAGGSSSPNGYGVLGANNSTTGSGSGVYGVTTTATGSGLYGQTSSATGVGVTGYNSAGGLAGSFIGGVSVTGNVSSATLSTSILELPSTGPAGGTGVITLGGGVFLHDLGGATNTFVGIGSAGAFHLVAGAITNSGFGLNSLFSETSGQANTAIGATALYSNTTASNNTAVGFGTLGSNISGSSNAALGVNSLGQTTTGNNNTAVGNASGLANVTGSSNTFLGAYADGASPSLTNASAIGANAFVGANNSMVLGSINGVNGGNASVNVGIGTTQPLAALDVRDNGASNSGHAGVFAQSATVGRNAMYGINTATSGTSNGGVFVTDSAAGSGVVAMNNAGGLAAYLSGDVSVTGTLTKGGGSFKIDDPIDPENKYLSHSFVESPDMMNIYNGIVTLDAHGSAIVTMPEWFSALNRDFRYQLTAIGAPGPNLYVASEISGNEFKIAGGKKGQRVSWQVTGIRQDAWANAHRIPTEEMKPANEQGLYLHPELYGAAADKNVANVHDAAKSTATEK